MTVEEVQSMTARLLSSFAYSRDRTVEAEAVEIVIIDRQLTDSGFTDHVSYAAYHHIGIFAACW